MTNPQSLVAQLAHKKIMIVGDVILDEYVYGDATRMSREAPIPVLEYRERRYIPGGAANPSANIVSLGSLAQQVGVVGVDDAAQHLLNALQARQIDVAGIIPDTTRPTTVKTRIIAQMGLRFPQQIARVDTLSRDPIDQSVQDAIMAYVEAHHQGVDAILVSDYRGGLLGSELVTALQRVARQHGILLTADAQGELDKYTGFDLVKCNADEAQLVLRRELNTDDDFADAALNLSQQLSIQRAMVITRGAYGATVATPDGMVTHCPASEVSDVFDTVGAGDTAIAVMTLALTAGIQASQAVQLANAASGIVVRHVGNYAPTPEQLVKAIRQE